MSDKKPIPKKRRGTRVNPDGSESTHLMMREYVPDRGWVVFPSLFQDSRPYADDTRNWVDMSDRPWEEVLEEATRRGEVYDFGEDEQGAINFADKGSWKKAHGGKVSNIPVYYESTGTPIYRDTAEIPPLAGGGDIN